MGLTRRKFIRALEVVPLFLTRAFGFGDTSGTQVGENSEVRITKIDPLPIVLGEEEGQAYQLVLVGIHAGARNGETLKAAIQVGKVSSDEKLILPDQSGNASTLLHVPYVSEPRKAVFAVKQGQRSLVEQQLSLNPVQEFVFYLFPSSHMCVAYENTMFLAHHDAAHAVEQALHMLEKYPEGGWSVEYAWGLKLYWDKHPEHRELIRRLVREGRLEVGGRFSPNIQDGLDGESLARQLAQTQWWMRETFGVQAGVAFDWDNPVFYPQESQLYRQAGLDGWVTGTYIDMNEDGARPQTSRRDGSPFFWHVGVGGSKQVVLAPARGLQDHYCANQVVGYYTFKTGGGLLRTLNPKAITTDYAQKLAGLVRETQRVSGMDFLAGSADCGDQSGPKEELYQKVRLWNATFANPKIKFLSAAACLKKAKATAKVTDQLQADVPWWIRHTGNMLVLRFRANEVSADLRFAETMAVLDSLAQGSMYPQEALSTAWEEVLEVEQHEQFFSGVCNGDDVLDWSNAKLDRAEAVARTAADLAMANIASRIGYAQNGQPVAVFNRLNWEVRDVVSITVPGEKTNLTVLDASGKIVPGAAQDTTEGSGVSFVATVPPLGYATYYLAPGKVPRAPARQIQTIENGSYRLTVHEKTGLITSLFDKTLGRELVDPVRPAGGFRLVWDDGGPGTDFWSISRPSGKVWRQGQYDNSTLTSAESSLGQELVVRGPLLGEGEAQFGEWREVCYRLAGDVGLVDIGIRYVWGPDPKKMRRAWLMFDLPLALRRAQATYGSPYSAVEYQEFSGDQPALKRIRTMHNWCDLYDAEAGIGVTVAGPSTQLELRPDGLAIALISRHGSTPGNLCIGLDGEHRFHYTLRVHRGDWRESQATQFGAEHEAGRSALRAVLASPRGGKMPTQQTLLPLRGEGLIVSALKQAHQSEDLLLRLYEAHGKASTVEIRDAAQHGVVKAWKSNILEEALAPIDLVTEGRVPVRPSEILSLRLALAPRGAEVPEWKTS